MSNLANSTSQFSWLSLIGIILLQSVSGIRSIVSAYSFLVEHHACRSQVQLNYLITALDIGRIFGWFSSTAAHRLPAWLILLIGLISGAVGYGVQYLYVIDIILSLSYWHVFLLNIIAGYSFGWIDTYCTLIANRNFKDNQKAIVALTSSYIVLTGKIYATFVEGIRGRRSFGNSSTYLLLSCLVPSVVGLSVALSFSFPKLLKLGKLESFPTLFMGAGATGLYAFLESFMPPFKHLDPHLRAVILVMAIVLSLPAPQVLLMTLARLKKSLSQVMPSIASSVDSIGTSEMLDISCVEGNGISRDKVALSVGGSIKKTVKLGDEHGIKDLLTSLDFWLYFAVHASTVTLVMVFETNIGQISRSRGKYEMKLLLTLSSTFGFFGRIFSVSFDWYTREKHVSTKTALIVIMMIPMPFSFFLLMWDRHLCLYISTCILGTCSGAITAISASTTSELFGHKNFANNYNIVLANIPIGSLLFGYMAALNYDQEVGEGQRMCLGLKCHHKTLIGWGTVSFTGTLLSLVLHLRTWMTGIKLVNIEQ